MMIFGLPDDVVKKLRQVFENDARIAHVWLYGSRAEHKERPSSDIDLCVEGETLKLKDLHRLENKIDELNLPWKVDLSLKHQIDNAMLQKHIENKGVNFLENQVVTM
jgi:predicted nucleotidyltransferase